MTSLPGLWARMEVIPALPKQGIVHPDQTWRPSRRALRLWHYWESDPTAPRCRCEMCKVTFTMPYIVRGWATDSHYPSNPKPYCRDCVRAYHIRKE